MCRARSIRFDTIDLASQNVPLAMKGCENAEAGYDTGMTCIALQRSGAPPQDLAEADRLLQDLAEFGVGLDDESQ